MNWKNQDKPKVTGYDFKPPSSFTVQFPDGSSVPVVFGAVPKKKL
jgi:hypothetical protein